MLSYEKINKINKIKKITGRTASGREKNSGSRKKKMGLDSCSSVASQWLVAVARRHEGRFAARCCKLSHKGRGSPASLSSRAGGVTGRTASGMGNDQRLEEEEDGSCGFVGAGRAEGVTTHRWVLTLAALWRRLGSGGTREGRRLGTRGGGRLGSGKVGTRDGGRLGSGKV